MKERINRNITSLANQHTNKTNISFSNVLYNCSFKVPKLNTDFVILYTGKLGQESSKRILG